MVERMRSVFFSLNEEIKNREPLGNTGFFFVCLCFFLSHCSSDVLFVFQ